MLQENAAIQKIELWHHQAFSRSLAISISFRMYFERVPLQPHFAHFWFTNSCSHNE